MKNKSFKIMIIEIYTLQKNLIFKTNIWIVL